jgi:hypothetical protein
MDMLHRVPCPNRHNPECLPRALCGKLCTLWFKYAHSVDPCFPPPADSHRRREGTEKSTMLWNKDGLIAGRKRSDRRLSCRVNMEEGTENVHGDKVKRCARSNAGDGV